MSTLRFFVLLAALLAAPSVFAEEAAPAAPAAVAAEGDPCANAGFGLPTGPTRAGLIPGDLGAGHRACGRKEVGLGFGGGLTVDLPAFYGRLGAQLALDGSWMIGDRLEVFAELEILRIEMLITPLASNTINLGHTSVGVSYGFLRTKPLALAVHSKVVLPTAVGLYRNALPFSLDVGVAGQLEINRHLALHGDATYLFQAMAGKGAAAPRAGGAVVVGAEFIPIPEVAIVLDLKSRFGWGDEPLDMLAGAIGLRFSDCKRFGFEIAGTIPIVGRDRTAAAVELRASVRFGKIARPLWGDVEHGRMMKMQEREAAKAEKAAQ
ncbi:MAG: hypothetical protein KDA24_13425 [Deltaproteobacteria bacterium]|nr:hypothetical protein [Deltaproteobacteria bacterium]